MNNLTRAIFIHSLTILSVSVIFCLTATPKCPCNSPDLCTVKAFERQKEVSLVTEGRSDFNKWVWDGIHNVINLAETDDSKLMCMTHNKKANYGILVKMPLNDTMKKLDLDNWMNSVITRANNIFADIIVVDLLDLVGNCYMSAEHGERVINLTKAFANLVKNVQDRKLFCVLPWKPPCFHGNCSVTRELDTLCNAILTSPESYITECDNNCRAKATMPMSNVLIGVDEYLFKTDIMTNKLFLGIPWHGYDYKCHTYDGYNGDGETSLCTIAKKENNSNYCDYEKNRKKMSFYDLETQYKEKYEKKHRWSRLYNAFFFDKNKPDGYHQIWYESDESLYEKYHFATEMRLRGVVIWTVDDLMNYNQGDAIEWNWLMHNMMVTGEYEKTPDMSMALKAMAIGVGCFIGGTIIGAIITTLIARRQMKLLNRRNKPPFHKDQDDDDETANFHEDDKYL